MKKDEKSTDWAAQAHRALLFVYPHRVRVAAVTALALATAALGAVEPLLMKYIFDTLGAQAIEMFIVWVAALIALNAAREAAGGVSNWITWKIRLGINYDLLEKTVGRLHSLPLNYHREETVGGIMTKLDRGINGFVSALSEIAFNVFPGVVYLVISLVIMLRLDLRLSAIVLVFAPLPALIGMWAAKEQTHRDKMLMEKWTRIFSRFNEVLCGIFTVKSFVTEDAEKKRFMDDVGAANSMVLRGVGRDTSVGAVKNTVAIAARVAAIGAGGWLVLKGEVSAGTLVAFLGYVGGIFGPVQGLTGVYQTIRRAAVSLDMIFSILDAGDPLGDAPGARAVDAVRGEVAFCGVGFRYKERPVLDGVSLVARPGEVVALVGPSGAGKSTMMALLQRLYDPTAGSISVDGADLRSLEPRSLRRHIGVVSQDALLFNDTAGNNIAYGRPGATRKEIEDAAKAANAHEFIMRLAHGYDTVIGERGGLLSAGERQRVTIARALIKNPPILILDEATSSLDAESEALVQEALERLVRERTTFVIAHRLSTVVRAHRILVLKGGRIIETGRHGELVEKSGYYASLVRSQTAGLLAGAA